MPEPRDPSLENQEKSFLKKAITCQGFDYGCSLRVLSLFAIILYLIYTLIIKIKK